MVQGFEREHRPSKNYNKDTFPTVRGRRMLRARGAYLERSRSTAGKDIQLVFNNAGFIVTGFFDSQPLGKHW